MSALIALKPYTTPLTGFKRKLKLVYQNTPFYRLHLSKSAPSTLSLTPMDPWPGQLSVGQQLCEGFLNVKEDLYMVSNFWQDCEDNADVSQDLYSFHFLRDLRSVGDATSRRLARDLILSWIEAHPDWKHASWDIEPLSQRLYNWLSLFDFYGSSAQTSCHKIIFKSLLKQARHLSQSLDLCSNGFARFQALKALIFVIVSFEKDLTSKKSNLTTVLAILEKECATLCFSDGCVQSRNPYKQTLFLKDLIDIRTILRQAQVQIPQFLQQRIEIVTPVVRFFRHGDGAISQLAQKHSLTPCLIDTILSLSDVKNATPFRLAKGGYERLTARHSIVLINTGPRSTSLPATYLATGCLNFEWSVGSFRLIQEASVCIETQDGYLYKAPIGRFLARTTRRHHQGHQLSTSSYELKDGLRHERDVYLSPDGLNLSGCDRVITLEESMVVLKFVLDESVLLKHQGKTIAVYDGKKLQPQWLFTFKQAQSLVIEEEDGKSVILGCFKIDESQPSMLEWSFKFLG